MKSKGDDHAGAAVMAASRRESRTAAPFGVSGGLTIRLGSGSLVGMDILNLWVENLDREGFTLGGFVAWGLYLGLAEWAVKRLIRIRCEFKADREANRNA